MEVIDQLKTKYKLSSETEQFLKSQINGVGPGNEKNCAEKCDGADEKMSFSEKIAADFDGCVCTFHVPSAGLQDGVPISVVKPKDRARRPGILVYFHGGASSFGSCEASQPVCMLLARELKCVVVNVDFRQGTEDKFPSMFDDGKTVVRWCIMNKSLLGGENDSKMGVCGSCLGGGIASNIAFETPGIDFQILIHPLVDWSCQGPSWDEFDFVGMPNFNLSAIIRKSVESQVRSENDKTNVRASPLLRRDFSNLPPTLLLLAEIDPLKDSNYEFKTKMKDANLHAESKLLKGSIHGFLSFPESFQDINGRAREIIAQFYKKHGVC